MTKYFLNIRQSGSTKKDDKKTYRFDLETPLSFLKRIFALCLCQDGK
jgi:hypothetical protein